AARKEGCRDCERAESAHHDVPAILEADGKRAVFARRNGGAAGTKRKAAPARATPLATKRGVARAAATLAAVGTPCAWSSQRVGGAPQRSLLSLFLSMARTPK